MTVALKHTIQLNHETDVGILTQSVRAICLSNRFDKIDTEQLVLASSEIGHNAIRHGMGGHAQIKELNNGKKIQIIIRDDGPGIPNIELAKREGYSTVNTSLGLGLEGAQRLVDYFSINSEEGEGTEVILEKYRPLSPNMIDYGLVSIPDNNYNYNGDQYVRKEYDGDSVILGVIDGPGQGYDAFAIAQSCKQFVENNYRRPLQELMTALHILMQESRDDVGITCSLAKITPGHLEYIGLGDTHAYICRDNNKQVKHLRNQEGRVGYVPKVKSESFGITFDRNITIILCTDGMKTIFEESIDLENAQSFANEIFDKYHRPSGDATILVANYNRIH